IALSAQIGAARHFNGEVPARIGYRHQGIAPCFDAHLPSVANGAAGPAPDHCSASARRPRKTMAGRAALALLDSAKAISCLDPCCVPNRDPPSTYVKKAFFRTTPKELSKLYRLRQIITFTKTSQVRMP